MTTLHTPDTASEAVLLAALAGLTQQAITELDEDSLQSLWQALTSVSALLLEEYLWRLGTRTLSFALHGNNNRHQTAVLTLRELAGEFHQEQQAVLHHHLLNIHTEIDRRGDVCFCWYDLLPLKIYCGPSSEIIQSPE